MIINCGGTGSSQSLYFDGTPCAIKVARTVWGGGKARDNIKGLPITIFKLQELNMSSIIYH